jgi:hypothetical protein
MFCNSGSFCDYGFKKNYFIKTFLSEVGLVFIYVLLKLWLKLKLNKK